MPLSQNIPIEMRELDSCGKRYACLAARGKCGKLSRAECVARTCVLFGRVTTIGVEEGRGCMCVMTDSSLNDK